MKRKNPNDEIILDILQEIDQARSRNTPLDELEYNLWRHLDRAGDDFPKILAGKVENLVLEIRELQQENLSFARGREVDENQGVDIVYNEMTNALSRHLG